MKVSKTCRDDEQPNKRERDEATARDIEHGML
jgi:hypothetical protein